MFGKNVIPLADIIADELAQPDGRNLQERLLQSMFMMERYRGIDAGWRDVVEEVADADVGDEAIHRLAQALGQFICDYPTHPDVGSAIWALSKLWASEDLKIYRAVLDEQSAYDLHAREQAACAAQVLENDS